MPFNQQAEIQVPPSSTTKISTKIGLTQERGRITTQFTVWCGACGDFRLEEAPNKDKFIEMIDKEWRLSIERGWVHKKCCKMMPTMMKLKPSMPPC